MRTARAQVTANFLPLFLTELKEADSKQVPLRLSLVRRRRRTSAGIPASERVSGLGDSDTDDATRATALVPVDQDHAFEV